MKKTLFTLILSLLILLPKNAKAQEPLTDWVIRSFNSDITLNKDNTLKVVEEIEADCGNLADKHGIYRMLPMQINNAQGEPYKNPIYLESITNAEGKSYVYEETTDLDNHVVTWKIGDPNKEVHGLNKYVITYTVKNVIRSQNSVSLDELYWNLNGNFWEIPIEKYSATINLPKEIKSTNSSLNIYSGSFGEGATDPVENSWTGQNILNVKALSIIPVKKGITVSLTFPKDIISKYTLTRQDEARVAGNIYINDRGVLIILILSIIFPIALFYGLYRLWKRYGRDPKMNMTVMPEFGIPDNLPPIEMGMIYGNGTVAPAAITAGIIGLATKGYLKIDNLPKKGILGTQDYRFTKIDKSKAGLELSETLLLEKLFKKEDTVLMSTLKNKFYKSVEEIKKEVLNQLDTDQLIDKKANNIAIGLYIIAFIVLFPLVFLSMAIATNTFVPFLSIFICFVLTIIFAIIMPRRPLPGMQLNQKIKGLKLFMAKAEKYRQQYLENEGVFEKLLPYAILFGLTKKWMKAMRSIYGEQYFNSYVPIWYYGSGMNSFNFDTFSSHLNSMTTSMSTTMNSSPSSSGAGGGGFSGGGSGGGGGGGW